MPPPGTCLATSPPGPSNRNRCATGERASPRTFRSQTRPVPATITVFKDDDSGFLGWLDNHADGYFINCNRNPKPSYLVMHRPSCPHFDRRPGVRWTKDYIKICSRSRDDLQEWASGTVGGEATLCSTCFG